MSSFVALLRRFLTCFQPAQGAGREGVRTKFFTAASLVNQLEEANKKFSLDQLLKRLDKIDLLIVDERGYLSFSRSGAEFLFEAFADRYERRSLLITSNLSFSALS